VTEGTENVQGKAMMENGAKTLGATQVEGRREIIGKRKELNSTTQGY